MKPTAFLIGSVLLMLLCVGACICIGLLNITNMINNQRHYVYCELLGPNMTKEEVKDILATFGTYQEHERKLNNFDIVRIRYDNPFTDFRFGGETTLNFKDGLLISVETSVGIGESKGLCRDWSEVK